MMKLNRSQQIGLCRIKQRHTGRIQFDPTRLVVNCPRISKQACAPYPHSSLQCGLVLAKSGREKYPHRACPSDKIPAACEDGLPTSCCIITAQFAGCFLQCLAQCLKQLEWNHSCTTIVLKIQKATKAMCQASSLGFPYLCQDRPRTFGESSSGRPAWHLGVFSWRLQLATFQQRTHAVRPFARS